jgi:hypothetical protein
MSQTVALEDDDTPENGSSVKLNLSIPQPEQDIRDFIFKDGQIIKCSPSVSDASIKKKIDK